MTLQVYDKNNKRWLVHAELQDFPPDSQHRKVRTLVFQPTKGSAIKRAYQIYTSHPKVVADNVNIILVEQLEDERK